MSDNEKFSNGKILNDQEHVLQRPDMYINSIKNTTKSVYIFEDGKIIYKEIDDYNAGLLNIFKEISDNAIDNISDSIKVKIPQTYIEINVDQLSGKTSVKNDGKFISISKQTYEYSDSITNESIIKVMYPVQALFGYTKCGSNYDNFEKDKNGKIKVDKDGLPVIIQTNNAKIGKNGMGSKLTSILSTQSIIEHTDTTNKKKIVLTLRNNMTEKDEPIIIPFNGKAYTSFTYYPDFKRFGIKGYSPNFIGMMKKMAYDIALNTGIKVIFNGETIKGIKTLQDYAKLYFDDARIGISFSTSDNTTKVLIIEQDDKEASKYGFRHVSFVNGNYTRDGGIHVDTASNAIFLAMRKWYTEVFKHKLKKGDNEKYFMMFITSKLIKPTFNSQTKYYLEGPKPKPIVIEDKCFDILKKGNFVQYINELIDFRISKQVKKTDGISTGYVGGFGDDANDSNFAGKRFKKDKCILFIAEGKSAKGNLDKGVLLTKNGRDIYGTLAIRGKFINSLKNDIVKVNNNKEVIMIKKILGLKNGVDYSKDANFDTLRYKDKIVIVCDADSDGSHIEGHISNYFISEFPTLISRGILYKLRTPIIKITIKKKTKQYFYTRHEYDNWVNNNPTIKFEAKYYKGLGTWLPEDVKYIFNNLQFVKLEYTEKDNEIVKLAFDDNIKGVKSSDQRKKWMYDLYYSKIENDEVYQPLEDLMDSKAITMTQFINNVFIDYAVAVNNEKFPHLLDGFAQSQRKIFYTSLLKNMYNTSIKVAQLCGAVSEYSGYHHGETNLQSTIIKMAQTFVGSSNLPLFIPQGMFGTRHSNSKDNGAACSRYIYVQLDPIAKVIFNPVDIELGILPLTKDDDNNDIEPLYYMPCIPMILVQGIVGTMGVAYSSVIPQCNPIDLSKWIRNKLMDVENKVKILPWWNGWTGTIKELGNNTYQLCGRIKRTKGNTYIIDELPPEVSTIGVKETLEKLTYIDEDTKGNPKVVSVVKNIKENHTSNGVYFEVETVDDYDLIANLKCINKKVSYNNMVILNTLNIPTKYNTINEILEDYYASKLKVLTLRRKKYLISIKNEWNISKNKLRYVYGVYNKEIDMKSFKDVESLNEFLTSPNVDIGGTKEPFYVNSDKGYEYLTRMLMTSMTLSKITELENDVKTLKDKYNELLKKSIKDLWLEELDAFDEEYQKWFKRNNERINTSE